MRAQLETAHVRSGAGETPEPASRARGLWRFLGSRAAIITLLPGLVTAIAALLLLIGQDTLRRESLAAARARLQEQTDARAWALRGALGQSEAVLAELRRVVLHGPTEFAQVGPALIALLRGRPGMAYVSISYPDGTFRGAFLDEHAQLRVQESTVGARTGQARHYVETADGELVQSEALLTDYDPRKRGFYEAASAARGPLWTAPYAFYDTRVTGVTRTEAVRRDGALVAVLTVDFDVAALSRFLTSDSLAGVEVVLFTRAGELLAAPASAIDHNSSARQEGRPLRIDDLGDRVLRDFFASGERPSSAFEHEGEPYMAALADASDDPALAWTVAAVAPERLFLSAAERYQRRGLIGFAIVFVLSLALSIALAHVVTRSERRARVAEERASLLGTKARELGSYRLVERLGRGGMGEVWRAEHRLLAREAAIKLIRPEGSARDVAERTLRFRREAAVLSQLRCRNTIAVFDYGVARDGTFYYVMELLDGLDFERLVERHGPLSAGAVVHLLGQVCASLAEAHERGLVHRDVKPANLFLCRAADELDIVKVLDFGLVRVLRHEALDAPNGEVAPAIVDAIGMSAHHGLLGTPGFMAPEQVMGHDLDGRADLYALGCVAFWLLTGTLLFDDADHARRSVACLQDVTNLEARLVDVPAPLVALITRCLSRKRGGRPRDARALGRELSLLAELLPAEQRFSQTEAQAFWADGGAASLQPASADETRLLMLAPDHGLHEDAG